MLIKELFKGFPNSAKNYYEWCKNNEELCELDLEMLEVDLFCELKEKIRKDAEKLNISVSAYIRMKLSL